jgi:HAD superfamily hydrolase (TIGR01549 family)
MDNQSSPWIIRKRVQVSGGFAIYAQLTASETMTIIVNKFIKQIKKKNCLGLWNLQLMESNGQYYISDVNMRIGTSSPLSLTFGINIFANFLIKSNCQHEPFRQFDKKAYAIRYLEEVAFYPVSKDVKGIVFDLDDTLLDHKLWLEAKLKIFIQNNNELFEDYLSAYNVGLQFIEEGRWDKLIDDVLDKCSCKIQNRLPLYQQWREISPEGSFLFPQVKYLLQELKTRGYQLALLTDNPPETQKQKIMCTGLKKYFDYILYSQTLAVEKPDPILFDDVSSHLCIDKKNLAMVGDNIFLDIKGAMDCQFNTAILVQIPGVKNYYSSRILDRLQSEYNEVRIITSLSYLLNLFK